MPRLSLLAYKIDLETVRTTPHQTANESVSVPTVGSDILHYVCIKDDLLTPRQLLLRKGSQLRTALLVPRISASRRI